MISAKQPLPKIRPAVAADAERIAQIHIQVWQQAYQGIMSADFLQKLSLETHTQQWHDALSQQGLGINLAIEWNHEVLGFCVYGPARDEDLAENKTTGELVALNILPEYWGRGLGSACMQQVLSASQQQGWTALYLWVLAKNTRAQKFYQALGFNMDGKEKTSQQLTGHDLHELRAVKFL